MQKHIDQLENIFKLTDELLVTDSNLWLNKGGGGVALHCANMGDWQICETITDSYEIVKLTQWTAESSLF